MKLSALIYGKPVPVSHVVEYGEHEISLGTQGGWQRVQYAYCYFGGGLNVVVSVPLDLLVIEQEDDECDICREMRMPCDEHA